ncbi:unnamed protein product, partial [Owenia fusiformis]
MLLKVGFIICLCISGTSLERGNKKTIREQEANLETNTKQYDLEDNLGFNEKRNMTWFGHENYEQERIKETWNDESNTGEFANVETYVMGDDVKVQLKNNCDFCNCINWILNSISCDCRQYMLNKTCTNLSELVSCIPYITFSLDISGFNFGTIQNGSFSNLPELTDLSLTDCNITRLEPDAFKGIKNLERLRIVDIGKNKEGISNLNYHLLRNCDTIQTLTLGKVRNIENDTFSAVASLKKLILQHKGILEHYKPFQALHNLRFLVLSQIGLRRIPDVILSYLVRLEKLHLENNEITSLSFKGNLGPRKKFCLLIQSNNIKSITKADMSQFINVASFELNLADNAIEDTEPNFLVDIKQIKTLSFEGNPKFGKTNLMHLLIGLKGKSIFKLEMTGCGIVIDKFNSSILKPLENSNLQ